MSRFADIRVSTLVHAWRLDAILLVLATTFVEPSLLCIITSNHNEVQRGFRGKWLYYSRVNHKHLWHDCSTRVTNNNVLVIHYVRHMYDGWVLLLISMPVASGPSESVGDDAIVRSSRVLIADTLGLVSISPGLVAPPRWGPESVYSTSSLPSRTSSTPHSLCPSPSLCTQPR